MTEMTVILVDDHVMVREGLRQLLLTFPGITVIDEAGDGQEAVKKIRDKQPDIVILDISMPKLNGIEAIIEIKKVAPETQILVLSMHDKKDYIHQAIKNGAAGYLLKASASDELRSALQFIGKGQIYLSPAISKSVVDGWLLPKTQTMVEDESESPLSRRERQIIKLLAEGYSNKKIADELYISIKTVETHRHHIMEKLDLDSFADLVKYAIKEKLIEFE